MNRPFFSSIFFFCNLYVMERRGGVYWFDNLIDYRTRRSLHFSTHRIWIYLSTVKQSSDWEIDVNTPTSNRSIWIQIYALELYAVQPAAAVFNGLAPRYFACDHRLLNPNWWQAKVITNIQLWILIAQLWHTPLRCYRVEMKANCPLCHVTLSIKFKKNHYLRVRDTYWSGSYRLVIHILFSVNRIISQRLKKNEKSQTKKSEVFRIKNPIGLINSSVANALGDKQVWWISDASYNKRTRRRINRCTHSCWKS